MRVERQPAYLLHKRQYRESSLIIEVLTSEHGRLSLMAKGARRPKSPFKPALNLFTPLLINYSARYELGTLTGAEQAADYIALRGEKLYCGYYLNELIIRLLHRHDPHERLFRFYSGALKQLISGERSDIPLRIFEKNLLVETGYGLNLDEDSSGNSIADNGLYHFDPESGVVRVTDERQRSRRLYSGRTLRALSTGEFPDGDTLKQGKYLLRSIIERQLDHRPLKSRELFLKMRHILDLSNNGI